MAAFCALVCGCRQPEKTVLPLERYEFNRPAMGTLFTITLFARNEQGARAAAREAFQRIENLEDILSDYQADSELLQLRDRPVGAPVPVSKDLFNVLLRAQKLSRLSQGAFDVTIGPYVRLWRFSRKRKTLPAAAELSKAAAAVGYTKLRLDGKACTVTLLATNMQLDVGGIAKGYAADQVLQLLKIRGINRALVAASGDLAIGDPPPGQRGWKVAISGLAPGTNQLKHRLVLRNCGVSTSGDTEQFIEIDGVRYSHIVDPRTGLGLTNRIQATIIAPNTTTTDALATTVCVLGAPLGLAFVESVPGCAAYIVSQDNGRPLCYRSERFKHLAQDTSD